MALKTYCLGSVPNRDAYVFALSQSCVVPHYRRMLLVNRRAPAATIGVEDLACATGIAGYRAVNLHYGRLVHRVADLLDLRVARYSPTSAKPLWATALAKGRESRNHPWLWCLYPEVCAAIDELDCS